MKYVSIAALTAILVHIGLMSKPYSQNDLTLDLIAVGVASMAYGFAKLYRNLK